MTWALISTDEPGDGYLAERLRFRSLKRIVRAGFGSDPSAVLFSQVTTDSYADEQKVEGIERHNLRLCFPVQTGVYRYGDREFMRMGRGTAWRGMGAELPGRRYSVQHRVPSRRRNSVLSYVIVFPAVFE